MQDGLRDGEHIRDQMQEWFREVLDPRAAPWIVVKGSIQERVAGNRPRIEQLRSASRLYDAGCEYRGSG